MPRKPNSFAVPIKVNTTHQALQSRGNISSLSKESNSRQSSQPFTLTDSSSSHLSDHRINHTMSHGWTAAVHQCQVGVEDLDFVEEESPMGKVHLTEATPSKKLTARRTRNN